jgi:hypothetical protein
MINTRAEISTKGKKSLLFMFAALFYGCEYNDSTIKPSPSQVRVQTLISNLSMTSGTDGDVFIIEGENFDTLSTNNHVKIGPNIADVTSSKKNQIEVTIPMGQIYKYGIFNIELTCYETKVKSSQTFNLTPFKGIAYTNKISYNPGETLTIFFSSRLDNPPTSIGIYNLDNNEIFSIDVKIVHQEIVNTAPYSNGFGFNPTVSITIPDNLKSGIYLIENKFPFVVKSKTPADIVVVYPSNTENAYCNSGGKSLYSHENRPSAVSFLRPMHYPNPVPSANFMEYGLNWLMKQGDFRINYISDYDLETSEYINNSKLLIIVGHSEYWTRSARKNFDDFVDKGGDALILSGNVMWWQVRYSADGNQLICYKEESADPITNPLLKTVNWYESMLHYPILSSIGADSEHGGYGNKADKGWDGYKIVAPSSPLLEGTGLKKGDIIKLPTDEYDGAVIKELDTDGYPLLDLSYYNFYKMELIGFDRASRFGVDTYGTFIAIQRSFNSGQIVNTASSNWCSYDGIGGKDGNIIQIITRNAIDKLVNGESIFSN